MERQHTSTVLEATMHLNRNSFRPGTAAYDYVWEIIHYVYGSEYDSEYKG